MIRLPQSVLDIFYFSDQGLLSEFVRFSNIVHVLENQTSHDFSKQEEMHQMEVALGAILSFFLGMLMD